MESCFLVHEEAGDILADLRARALDSHMNVILDGTMNGPESTERKIRELRSHGYSIRAMFVDISPATSKRRADGRYRDGMVRYTTARLGHGGATCHPMWSTARRRMRRVFPAAMR
ncbi:zeta toxin family protein [Bifidobacterium breve]|uniref:zeta toxin family protein n=1 Tax=Bifidobacterium breve TaxID=1685 RepID=UPI000CA0FA24|nr:Zeta toxin protein [Bifidobacterium breve]